MHTNKRSSTGALSHNSNSCTNTVTSGYKRRDAATVKMCMAPLLRLACSCNEAQWVSKSTEHYGRAATTTEMAESGTAASKEDNESAGSASLLLLLLFVIIVSLEANFAKGCFVLT
uniref:Uncharacterized protein n=1 Tax=Lygus hesperus TaxID=30085 RepID=A0A0A9X8I9_LYGHE